MSNGGDIKLGIKLVYDGKDVAVGVDDVRKKLADLEKQTASNAISAKQMSAALRGVPAQFTDIFTSLASGQAPMTVLLQQGGQLKDMFGGVGAATRALGGYVAGMINPLTLAAGAAVGLAYAYNRGAEESKALANALVLTGNAAATTVGQVYQMADAIAASSNATRGAAVDVLTQLVATGKVAQGSLQQAGAAIVAMSDATGRSVESLVKDFESLGKDPVAASLKLSDQYGYLTAEVYKQIKALKEEGRERDAATLAQNTYAEAVQGMSGKVTQNLGYIEQGWKAIKAAAFAAGDAMLGVGREAPLEARLTEVNNKIAAAAKMNAAAAWGFSSGQRYDVSELEKQKRALEAVIQGERDAVTILAQSNAQRETGLKTAQEQEKAAKEFGRIVLGNMTKEQQLAEEIKKIRETGAKAGVSEGEIEKQVQAARAAADSTRGQISDYAKLTASIKEKIAAQNIELATGEKATAGERLRATILEQLRTGQIKLTAAQKASVLALADILDAGEKKIALAKEEQKTAEEVTREEQQRADQLSKSAETTRNDAEQIRQHTAELGLSESAVSALRAARVADQIALQEHQLAELEASGQCTAYSAALRDQIEALKERQAALREQLTRQADVESAKKAAEEWKHGWEETDRLAREVFTTWATEGGKAGEKIGQTLKKALLSAIYEATLRPIAFQIYGATTNALGFNGAGANSGSSGGTGSLLSTGSNLSSLYNAGSSLLGLSGSGASFGSLALANISGAAGGDALGTLISANASNWGVSGGSSLLGSIGTALPYIGLAAAAISLLSGSFGGGTPHAGGIVYSDGTTAETPNTWAKIQSMYVDPADAGNMGESDWTKRFSQSIADALTPTASGIATLLNSASSVFGDGSAYKVGLAFSSDGDSRSRGRYSIINGQGDEVYDWGARKFNKDSQQGISEFISATGEGARAVLDAMDLPGWADEQLAALGDKPSIEALQQVVTQITVLAQAAEQLAPTLGLTSDRFAELSLQLGSDVLNSYYANYYSEAERLAVATDAVRQQFADIGLAMPTTRAEYRALAETYRDQGEAGAETYEALLRLNTAFASVTDAAQTTAEATVATTAALGADRKAEVEARRAAQAETVTAAEDAASAATDLFDKIQAGIKSIDAWLKGSLLDANSLLSPEEKIAEAQAQFDALYTRTLGGDTDALAALPDAAEALRSLARDGYASSPAYAAIDGAIQQKLAALGNGSSLTPEARAAATHAASLAYQDQMYQGMLDDYRYQALAQWSEQALAAGYDATTVQNIKSNAFWQGNVEGGGGNTVDWAGALSDPQAFADLAEQVRMDGVFNKKALAGMDDDGLQRTVASVLKSDGSNADEIIKSLEKNGQAQSSGLVQMIEQLEALNEKLSESLANDRLGVPV